MSDSGRKHRDNKTEDGASDNQKQLIDEYMMEINELRSANLAHLAEINSLKLELEKSLRKKEKVENALGKVVTDMLVETPGLSESASKRKMLGGSRSSSSGKRQRKHERRSRG